MPLYPHGFMFCRSRIKPSLADLFLRYVEDLAGEKYVKEKFTEGRTQEEWLRHIYESNLGEKITRITYFWRISDKYSFFKKKVDPNGF